MTITAHGNINASLPFQTLYFISDVIFLEFTFVLTFYWIIMDSHILFSLFILYLDIFYKNTLDIKCNLLRKNFVILRVSGQSVYGTYHLWMHMFLSSFHYLLGWAVMQFFIFIIFPLHTSISCLVFIIILYYLLLTPLKNHV